MKGKGPQWIAGGILALWFGSPLPGGTTEWAASEKDGSRKDAVVASYIQYCRDQARRDARCERHRKEAVQILKEDILTIGSSADPAHLGMLGKVLRSDEPELRAAAADAMGMIRPTPVETPALVKAATDPAAPVQYAALRALEASQDPAARLVPQRARLQRGGQAGSGAVPDAKALGVPVYAGASFVHFASDMSQGRAAFVTADPVAKVLSFYSARARRPAMRAEQFTQAYPAKPKGGDAAEQQMGMEMVKRMMQAMQEGKSPEEMQAEIMKSVAGMATELPVQEYADQTLYGAPMFVVLEETALGGITKPARYVVVFEDRALRQTGLVLHVPPVLPTVPPAVGTEPDPDALKPPPRRRSR